ELQVYLTREEGRIVAGAALLRRRKFGVSGWHVPPYTPCYGPLVLDSDKKQRGAARTEERGWLGALLDALPRVPHADFILPTGHHDPLPWHWRGWQSDVRITHVVRGSVEEYLGNIIKRKAAYLRKLQGMVERGELVLSLDHEVAPVLDMWARTAEHKSFTHRDDLLRGLFRDPGEGFWTCVRISDREGQLLGGSVLVHDHRRAWNLVNGVRRDVDGVLRQINMLLMDAGIQHFLGQGMVFDFEGSMLPGVGDFYTIMGGEQVPCYRFMRSRSLRYFALRTIDRFRRERRGGGA
ncbi:MAG: GNAT family N-acetyltransferase, partial [Calditrichaeota bacterium]|nr:GNAT family N-acetyltransferase [Calditrichota bacterium]